MIGGNNNKSWRLESNGALKHGTFMWRCCGRPQPGVPKKAERLIFVTLIFENIAYFDDKALSSEKNDTKIIEIGWAVLIL